MADALDRDRVKNQYHSNFEKCETISPMDKDWTVSMYNSHKAADAITGKKGWTDYGPITQVYSGVIFTEELRKLK